MNVRRRRRHLLRVTASVFLVLQENHPDRPDIQKCMASFKNLSVS